MTDWIVKIVDVGYKTARSENQVLGQGGVLCGYLSLSY